MGGRAAEPRKAMATPPPHLRESSQPPTQGFLVSLRQSKATKPVMWVISPIVSVFVLVSFYTIGDYYLPAALLLIMASIAAKAITLDWPFGMVAARTDSQAS